MNVLYSVPRAQPGVRWSGRRLATGTRLAHSFVRASDRLEIKQANLAVMVGDVMEYATVERAVRDAGAVASALGHGNSLGSGPVLIDGVLHIIRAMDHAGVRRFVYLSIRGVGGRGMQLASWTGTSCCRMFAAVKRFACTGEMLI